MYPINRLIRIAFCLTLIGVNFSCLSAQSQDFKWPWEQQQQQQQQQQPTVSPFLSNLRKTAQERAKQQANSKAADEARWKAYLDDCIRKCISPMDKQTYLKSTANPQQNASGDQGWNALKNAMGKTASTSEHMRGYNGNQAYMGPGRAGTDVTGGSRYQGSYDGTGSLGNDGQYTRQMPAQQQYNDPGYRTPSN